MIQGIYAIMPRLRPLPVNYIQITGHSTGNSPYIRLQVQIRMLVLNFLTKGTGGYGFREQ